MSAVFVNLLLLLGLARVETMSPSLSDLLTATGGSAHGLESCGGEFARVQTDSRRVRPGDVFFALPGERHDGHEFVEDAFAAGATACVVSRTDGDDTAERCIVVEDTLRALADFARHHRRQQDALVVGVTGSVGKTTTREAIHAALSAEFDGIRSRENYNNHVGVPLTLLDLRPEHEYAVVELAASAAGEIGALSNVAAPDVGVVTSVTAAHLEGFGDLETIARTKGELVDSLPAEGFAVLNGDDPRVRAMAGRSKCPVILVGEDRDNDLRITNVCVEPQRVRFTLDGFDYELPATGRQHVLAGAIAVAIGREVGMQPETIAAGLRSFTAAPGRCQVQQFADWTVIDDTYNANPASTTAACRLLSEWPGAGPRILILGDMLELGAEADAWHERVGETVAASGIDRLLALGTHAGRVVHGAHRAGMDAHRLAVFETLDSLLAILDCWLEPGSVLLVKGSRGMRMERVVHWLHQQAASPLETTATFPDGRAVA